LRQQLRVHFESDDRFEFHGAVLSITPRLCRNPRLCDQ
jgi:hypothetical protein